VDASLKRLQLDYIDLYQLHGFDPLTPLEESLSALNDLVRAGKIRHIGFCNMTAWHMMKSLHISRQRNYSEIVSSQSYYTIAGRDVEREIFPFLNDQKLGLLVWSPLAGGFLSGKFKNNAPLPENARRNDFDFPPLQRDRAYRCIEAMEPIAKEHGVSIARVALAWLLSKKEVTSVIVGAKRIEQLEDNLQASNLILSDEQLNTLNEVSKLPIEYPGWMYEMQGKYRSSPPVK
jgi:aryl-alcohol dehydrogenase-like predicted oxidoreductase